MNDRRVDTIMWLQAYADGESDLLSISDKSLRVENMPWQHQARANFNSRGSGVVMMRRIAEELVREGLLRRETGPEDWPVSHAAAETKSVSQSVSQ